MEPITFILTVLGFVIAYITYKNTYIKEPKEDIEFLISKYDNAEKATIKLILELKTYTSNHNTHNERFKEGLTFQDGINFLESAHNVLFTDDARQSILVASMGRKQIDELIKRIEIHRENIEAIQTHLNFYFKKDFDARNRLS